MPYANASAAKIYYEAEGPDGAETALLIEGFSAQMIGWHPRFRQLFLDRGLRIVTFDNRDVGLSAKYGGSEDLDGFYSLADMANDGFSVLDDLGIERAHIVGQSMGGVIAQIMATAKPERVKSLSLIYTMPSRAPEFLRGTVDPAAILMVQPRLPREEAVALFVEREKICASTDYPFDEAWIRELGGLSYDRCYAPDGLPRQFAAIWRTPQPFLEAGRITMPTVILHGRDDGHIRPEAAMELGRLIPQAEVHIYAGMGHELAERLWHDYVDAICRTIALGARIQETVLF